MPGAVGAHDDLCADQRHAAVCHRAGGEGLAQGAGWTIHICYMGWNVHAGKVTYAAVAHDLNLPFALAETLLAA